VQTVVLFAAFAFGDALVHVREINVTSRLLLTSISTKHPPVIGANECFSFGSIQTTGIVLDGDGTSEYAPENIHTHFTLRQEKLPEELQARRALWGILGMIKIKKTIAQVLERWQRGAKDKIENKKVFPIPLTPQDICAFVFSHENWTPGGLICPYHTLVHEFGREEVDKTIAPY
jgi:hypothetical protein